MKRFGKILCGFGIVELLCALVALFIFNHVPSPWGTATIPGGLSDVGGPDPVETAMNWQARVFVGIFATGFVGLAYLLFGILACAISAIPRGHA